MIVQLYCHIIRHTMCILYMGSQETCIFIQYNISFRPYWIKLIFYDDYFGCIMNVLVSTFFRHPPGNYIRGQMNFFTFHISFTFFNRVINLTKCTRHRTSGDTFTFTFTFTITRTFMCSINEFTFRIKITFKNEREEKLAILRR